MIDYEALERESLLYQVGAMKLFERARAVARVWTKPYVESRPKDAVRRASVWFTAYPASTLGLEGQAPLEVLGDPCLWDLFCQLGITGIHTGPLLRSGGIEPDDAGGWRRTPSTDGHFDPISLELDESIFGTDDEFRRMVLEAEARNAVVIADVVPGHTGTGADFRLAQLAYKNYPGLFLMVRIREEDWPFLPKVDQPFATARLTPDQVYALEKYIPGMLQRQMAGLEETGWEATGKIEGCDGKVRRWVYLHYFKKGQPTLNWVDLSEAASTIISGQITRYLLDWRVKSRNYGPSPGLGAKMVRLDANPFLGIERRLPKAVTADAPPSTWSEAHPLSQWITNKLAWHTRRLGGHSFQELNMSLDAFRRFSELGPDLAYDFVTRPACEHAALTGNADLLRLMYRLMADYGLDTGSLIHALQNHDEITYELVHFLVFGDQTFDLGGRQLRGLALRKQIRDEMKEQALSRAPWNRESGNGLCTTFVGFLAAALGLESIEEVFDNKAEIQQGHLLLAAFNALQPGVFAFSGWDLVGALPLDDDAFRAVPEAYIGEPGREDARWGNRGAYDLLGHSTANVSRSHVPRARCLYGPVPAQMADRESFCRKLQVILSARKTVNLDEATFNGVADADNPAVFAMVSATPALVTTILNFSHSRQRTRVDLSRWIGDAVLVDMLDPHGAALAAVSGIVDLDLSGWEYRLLKLKPAD
ncbi:MAG: maltose alpha-D-glucosyltransferase [Bryobacterales bacterium]|nr:maltose alpha-D-glucosyltransferase [Bryobacterales bacterium]